MAQLPSLQAALAPLAAFVGARAEDMVFITNATAAMNCMFDAVPLAAGDECVCLDIIYPAVRNALAQRCERAGAKILQVKCPFPLRAADDVTSAIVTAIDSRPRGRVKMLCIDHVVRVADAAFNQSVRKLLLTLPLHGCIIAGVVDRRTASDRRYRR
jgi:isopenicillin-N epimerase